jgi:hypothetical protein
MSALPPIATEKADIMQPMAGTVGMLAISATGCDRVIARPRP